VTGSERFVTLKGGLIVSVEAVRFALDLERRGLDLVPDQDGYGLLAGPRERITEQDRMAIRQWRHHLHAILAYAGQEIPQ
jgi:hypothetical protein